MRPISASVLLGACMAKQCEHMWGWLTIGLSSGGGSERRGPCKHERQKGVWSGFERALVTCSPYVSAFHQLYSDLKQVASLPNKPQLLWRLLRCDLSCQHVKNPYMDQNRDRVTHKLYQGGKKLRSLPCRRAAGVMGPLGLFYWWGITASLIYFLLLWWAKRWFWPFCLQSQRSLGRPCPYVCGCLTRLPCLQVRNGSGPGAFANCWV